MPKLLLWLYRWLRYYRHDRFVYEDRLSNAPWNRRPDLYE